MAVKNVISWFEIPALDLDRAQRFYETIFGIEMIGMEVDNITMIMFPLENMEGVGGAICEAGDLYTPSADGPLIYLNASPDVQQVLDKVEVAGGKIALPKTLITPEYGYMAAIIDTEGNRVGLHSISM